jgi:hypothetical protein
MTEQDLNLKTLQLMGYEELSSIPIATEDNLDPKKLYFITIDWFGHELGLDSDSIFYQIALYKGCKFVENWDPCKNFNQAQQVIKHLCNTETLQKQWLECMYDASDSQFDLLIETDLGTWLYNALLVSENLDLTAEVPF